MAGPPAVTGATRLAVVLGWPVGHSRSPQMLTAAFAAAGIDAVLLPIGVPPERFALALGGLRAMGMLGASVTLPHKLAAAALCEELSDAARAVGAVNCVQLAGDRLIGHNTDAPGFSDGLAAAGCARPAHAVVLGGGGAARAIAYALRPAAVDVIAREPDRVAWTRARPWTEPELRAAFARAELVVDCTPSGLADPDAQHAFADGLPLAALRPGAWVATLVYHRRTILLERAAERGHSTVDGRAMLVHQGARAFAIWTGRPAPIAAMARALDDSLAGT